MSMTSGARPAPRLGAWLTSVALSAILSAWPAAAQTPPATLSMTEALSRAAAWTATEGVTVHTSPGSGQLEEMTGQRGRREAEPVPWP